MPPRRRSSKASRKESDERLSIAETIAGLANSIEQPAFSPCGVITRQNSYDAADFDRIPSMVDKEAASSAADFARIPSVVVEEGDSSAALPVHVHGLPLPARSASVDGFAATADGHRNISSCRVRSPATRQQVHIVSSAGDVFSQSQSASTVIMPGSSENVACTQTDHLHADAASSVSVSLHSDTVYSAVLMGWNPAVLATCPASIESVSPGEVASPLSALRTVDPANNNSNIEVLKLPLVLEPVSDGTWQLVPVSASAAFEASVMPNGECVIHPVAQRCVQSVDSSNVTQAAVENSMSVSNGSVLAVDNSPLQLHSLGSVSIVGKCYESAGFSDRTHQGLSGISCNGPVTHSISDPSSGEDTISGSSVLGSLGALRDYYKRISTNDIQSSSVNATPIQMLNSATNTASVGHTEINCTDSLHSEIPVVCSSASNDQVLQLVPCTNNLSARNVDVHADINTKLVSTTILPPDVAGESLTPRSSSRVLPPVSVDCRRMSSENKQLLTESHHSLDRSQPELALSTDKTCEQIPPKRQSKLLHHLPPKKRQKVSGSDIHCEVEQNGCRHNISHELNNEHTVDGSVSSVNVSTADTVQSDRSVTHVECSLSANVAASGILDAVFLLW